MPIQIRIPTQEELAAAFSRRPRSAENVEDYMEVLQENKIGVGSGLQLQTQVVQSTDGEQYTILSGSVDEDDPGGVTIRAAKRRFNMAAQRLGFSLDWRELDGWLILRGVELRAEEPSNGQSQ